MKGYVSITNIQRGEKIKSEQSVTYHIHQALAAPDDAKESHDRDKDDRDAHNVDTHGECWDQCHALVRHLCLSVMDLKDMDQQCRRWDLV